MANAREQLYRLVQKVVDGMRNNKALQRGKHWEERGQKSRYLKKKKKGVHTMGMEQVYFQEELKSKRTSDVPSVQNMKGF
ncbi:hypothetical protein KP509_1Z120600 [Ceratopteris richardii]|nr:hypothetical protein KP509_1Z120600 [Ceratopteris richardii]